ncbi:hypothetical protein J2792_000844 [Novosphingobium capsulatum]|uniref:DUF1826 domain-containing protein n=1 Tax=Novosphingobium capsulatum TaxID=13688 RepID=A0ABU1MIH5_9SPHN|nr:DUF1826 domain-containing protein [Novosphingobium capsulatum]MDR6510004.1 hypothetical protein [Novosphingobium capsulatum]
MTTSLPRHPAIACAPCEAVLAQIHQPAVQLALWQRPRPAALAWLDGIDLAAIADIDCWIDAPFRADAVGKQLHAAGFPAQPATAALTADIVRQMRGFAAITHSPRLRLRLDVVETDACRRFHMDYVSVRLLLPLVGPGTQWVMTDAPPHAPVQQLQPGHVGLFKGRLAVAEPAVLHRSPPIAGTGQRRLLLVLDPLDQTANDQLSGRAA